MDINGNFNSKILVYDDYSIVNPSELNKRLQGLSEYNSHYISPMKSTEWISILLEGEISSGQWKYEDVIYFSTKEDFDIWKKKVADFDYKNEDEYKQEILKFGGISVDSETLNNKPVKTISDVVELEGLYTELAKVRPFDEKRLVNFSKSFGIPIGSLIGLGDDGTQDGIICIQFSFLLPLYTELTIYRFIFNCWIALKSEDENLIKGIEDRYYKAFDGQTITFMGEKRTIKKSGTKKTLIEIIISFLNAYDYIPNTVPIRYEAINNSVKISLNYQDLLSVAYHQLIQAIVKNASFKVCDNCGHLFEIIHEGRRFCPPLPGRKRSTCENTFNQRLKRKRRSEQNPEESE